MKTIPLTEGQLAIVDDCDFERIASCGKWQITSSSRKAKTRYAMRIVQRNFKRNAVYMHRLVIGAAKGQQVDHINHNGLDNRRCNLRIVTASQNGHNRADLQPNNTSGFTGVVWNPAAKKWQAQMMVNRRMKYLGCFANKSDAIKARDDAYAAMKI